VGGTLNDGEHTPPQAADDGSTPGTNAGKGLALRVPEREGLGPCLLGRYGFDYALGQRGPSTA